MLPMRLLWAGRVLLVNLLVLAVLCGLVEAAVRLTHPQIGSLGTDAALIADHVYGESPGLRPGATGTSNGARMAVDEQGVWRYASARPGRPGWLFLGDSVTMGLGVEPDSTFAGRAAARQDTLDVLNPSLVGYSSADYTRALDGWLARTAAAGPPLRRVSVLWTLNDVYADLPVETAPKGTRRFSPTLHRFIQRHVRTYQWLRTLLFDRPQAYYDHDRQFYADETSAHLQAALDHLTEMHQRCQSRGLSFEVILLPYAAQLRTSDDLPQRTMMRLLAARGIVVRDLLPSFRQAEDPTTLYLYGDGIHLSAAGHRLVVEAIDSHEPI